MWSTLESKDGPGRHIQMKMVLTIDQPQVTPPCSGCASTTRLQQMANKTETFFGCSGITCFAVYALTFSSSAHGGAGAGIGLRFGGIGRELRNVECSSRISCNTTGATIPIGTASASFVFWHHGSGSTTGDRSNVPRQTAEDQGEQGSSGLARHDAEDLNNTLVLQNVRVWTDKTDGNADAWEAAIRHFNKIGTSSCFLIEMDKGCLQPSIFDDSIFLVSTLAVLLKKRSRQLGTCCENQCQSKSLSGVLEKSMVEFVM